MSSSELGDLSDTDSAQVNVRHNPAIQVVKDGEGASKFVAITVTGAETNAAARKIGLAVANSPLVKTALFASDPNWGRILAAVGGLAAVVGQDRGGRAQHAKHDEEDRPTHGAPLLRRRCWGR